MVLNPLTLNITTGVVGRPFSATVSGQTNGSTLEVVGQDGTYGFGLTNNQVTHPNLPSTTNTLVLRETLAGTGTRDSRIQIVANDMAVGVAGLTASGIATPALPFVSGNWYPATPVSRVLINGSGSVTIDAKNAAGFVTSAVYSWSGSNAVDFVDYFYPGDDAVAIRATLTGTAALQVI